MHPLGQPHPLPSCPSTVGSRHGQCEPCRTRRGGRLAGRLSLHQLSPRNKRARDKGGLPDRLPVHMRLRLLRCRRRRRRRRPCRLAACSFLSSRPVSALQPPPVLVEFGGQLPNVLLPGAAAGLLHGGINKWLEERSEGGRLHSACTATAGSCLSCGSGTQDFLAIAGHCTPSLRHPRTCTHRHTHPPIPCVAATHPRHRCRRPAARVGALPHAAPVPSVGCRPAAGADHGKPCRVVCGGAGAAGSAPREAQLPARQLLRRRGGGGSLCRWGAILCCAALCCPPQSIPRSSFSRSSTSKLCTPPPTHQYHPVRPPPAGYRAVNATQWPPARLPKDLMIIVGMGLVFGLLDQQYQRELAAAAAAEAGGRLAAKLALATAAAGRPAGQPLCKQAVRQMSPCGI